MPVGAVACAVPRDADHAGFDPVVGQTAGDVRVVMLDRYEPHVVEHSCVGRRTIPGMEIMRDDAGGEIEQAHKVADGFQPATVGALVSGIAQMLARKPTGARAPAKEALALSPARPA